MWSLSLDEQWQKDQKHYAKKHPRELAAVLRNLDRYQDYLRNAKNAKCIQAGFIHPEPKGVVAIDQRGPGGSLQETRLYIFPEESSKTIHLITIGNKDSQEKDIRYTTDFVNQLTNKTQHEPTQ